MLESIIRFLGSGALVLKAGHEMEAREVPPSAPLPVDMVLRDISWIWLQRVRYSGESSTTGTEDGSSPPPSPPTSDARTGAKSKAHEISRKRKPPLDEEDDDESYSIKRGNHAANLARETRFLACPYFKRNPQRFSKSHVCVGPGWPTVYRLKEHLFRKHAPPDFQCRRCFQVLKSENELDAHQRATKTCKVREKIDAPGQFTHEQGKALRKRVKGISNQTEREKWIDIYRILFPDEEVPEPYYHYDALGGPSFTEFFQREFPPRVKGRLEANLAELDRSTVNNILDICLLANSEVHGLWNVSFTGTKSSTTTGGTEASSISQPTRVLPAGHTRHETDTDGSVTTQSQTLSRRGQTPSMEGSHSEPNRQTQNPKSSQAGGQPGEQLQPFYGGEELLLDFESSYQFCSSSPGYFDEVARDGVESFGPLPLEARAPGDPEADSYNA